MHSSLCQVVVLVNASLQKQLEINDWTHQNGVHFDFGPKFTCVDPTGEQPLSGMIVSVENVCDLLEFVTLDT